MPGRPGAEVKLARKHEKSLRRKTAGAPGKDQANETSCSVENTSVLRSNGDIQEHCEVESSAKRPGVIQGR